ncbi:alcohol dehydrogenase catalytic domain-containing protein [Mycolicibacterium smegmatis]|uniref:alcohol dehydrogenase catalytic domain-containing protein n=1 Tax=Mycolicibacterium smegmatis TaxID=1772 RepID=UPI0005D897E1|nr:alcohol dehydrogenase catalytic domain-containing protein [Mycolicibacterium smegmatis]MDF1897813.1 alcohol dehydrogenase catalytic domain-containing protein [Mycolicibacterium smegmatis]MDF1904369.1 alcohol dehydrogenase catalytic domain-containing protein [Mycolicibacterium smegmatis]MDF1917656.1 alcohol dehydrogenase catalytic domain-containing protein [Mycolicibacterium smegmatis]MDF1923013.1 alcohol dehydrogenase catalytic domain-containing protein [Mycolicibacterium smegmatis]UAK58137
MSSYRAYQVTGRRKFELVQCEIRDPAEEQVRIRTLACGVCHSDALAVEGQRPNPEEPVVPGHEVVGVVDAVGSGIQERWRIGERVGVGFLGGQCGHCDYCRRGDFVNCLDQPLTGTTVDGGYSEMLYVRESALVRVPEGFDALTAAPLLCAGVTVFNALRAGDAPPNTLVAVQGLGGLGHLGVQYAKKLGYEVAAIARGTDKADLAATLGADHYIDSATEDVAAGLTRLGGAAAVVATASSGQSMAGLVAGLRPRGRLVVVGAAPDPIPVQTPDLIFGGRTIVGSLTGSAIDNEDNLAFSLNHQIAPMIERMPFTEAPQAYERMMSGHARFRVVLDFS